MFDPGGTSGPAGVGTAAPWGTGATARATGVSEGLGVAECSSVDRSPDFEDGFIFPLPFFFEGVASVSPFNFFFGFGVASSGAGDFLSAATAFFAFSVGSGVDSSPAADFFFLVFGLGVGDLCGAGEGLFFAFGLDDLGRGVGDSSDDVEEEISSWRVLINSSRFRFSSSPTCARTRVATSALSTIAVIHRVRTRATAADRIRPEGAFKPAARPVVVRSRPSRGRAPVSK